MKALKIIGIVLVVLVAAVLVAGLVLPGDMRIERSVTIDAPQDFVWEHVNTLEGMQAWSPWVDRDPDQETSLEGEDGTVGAVHSWNGDENVGAGSQEITSIEQGRMETHLHFTAPWESHADAFVNVEETEDGQSKASWGFETEMGFPMNIMGMFMDMDASIGKDFEEGLNNLKTLVEESKASRNEFDGFTIQETEMEAKTYIGKMDSMAIAELTSDYFGARYGELQGALAQAEDMTPVSMPCSMYFDWNEENGTCVVVAALPMTEGASLDGFNAHTLGGKALMIEHRGAYEGLGKAHEAMGAYMKWHGVELRDAVVEEYVTDPMTEEDPANWVTRIYYPV